MAADRGNRASRLTTARLRLRPVSATDRTRLAAIFRDPYVRRYLWDSQIADLAQVDAIIASSEETMRLHGLGLWCAAERAAASALAIGFAGARPMVSGEFELIYGFLPEHWGRGFALEAARAVVERAFALDQPRVWAGTDVENKASERVMRRLGMAFDHRVTVGGLPQIYYRLDRAEAPSE